MKHAEAARILDLADAPLRRSTPAVTLGLAILTIAGIFWFAAHEVSARGSLHSAHQAGSLSRSTEFGRKTTAMESDKMKKLISIGVVSTAISASAMAQNAVQWRVEDGGNGHWYAVTNESLVYPQLRAACESKGGHLVTLTTEAEWSWVKARFAPASTGRFAGGYQDHSDPQYAEPNGGWRWVTGEPFILNLNYMGSLNYMGFDDCPGGSVGLCGCGPAGAQDVLCFTTCCNNRLDDIGDGIVQNCDSWARDGVIEWSADCNNDGIVDYGQIRAGEYEDLNANNIPDCCEYSTPCDCDADIIQDNAINGVDLAAIMNAWGTDGGKIPRCDVDGSGIVDGSDLTIVLDAWGPCP